MRHLAVLSIDLGSAFTKIGVRKSRTSPASLIREPEGPELENICIPSIVARRSSRGTSETIIGARAAVLAESPNIVRYTNWKAPLFGKQAVAGPLATARLSQGDAFDVAVDYLRELRVLLESRRGMLSLPTRLCVPAFDSKPSMEVLAERLLTQSGWTPAGGRAALFEPESNAIGILTRGRNASGLRDHSINMPEMLEPGLKKAFRRVMDGSADMPAARRDYVVLMTDIGAFTTDFGLVMFDVGFFEANWSMPPIEQHSIAHGARKLQAAILKAVDEESRALIESAPTRAESYLRSLSNGKTIKIPRPRGGIKLIGDGDEGDRIASEIAKFARHIAKERAQFCATYGVANPDEEVLSGGGSLIPGVRDVLQARTSARFLQNLYDDSEPEVALARGARPMTPHQMDTRRNVNQELLRGGSAIGGTSIFFDS